MEVGLVLAVVLALAFAFTNGVQDSANSIATLIATRAARPAPALAMATVAILAGPFLLGAAVASTVAGMVDVEAEQTVQVVAGALVAALAWNLAAWYYGIPSSSSHALIGGLVGTALATAGLDAVNWGGFDGLRPVGVLGVLVVLATSPAVGAIAALVVLRVYRRALRRGTRRFAGPVRDAQWVTSTLLSIGQGANDAQKAVGLVAAVLLAEGTTSSLDPPLWAIVACSLAMAAGTLVGGWRIVRTIGKRIYDLRPLDALASQTGSAGAILGATIVGAPISSTHVVSSSVVGAGLGRRHYGRIRWSVVRQMGLAWVTTAPGTALLAAVLVSIWRWLT
jgi:PiT family inorganic phosphate transporter